MFPQLKEFSDMAGVSDTNTSLWLRINKNKVKVVLAASLFVNMWFILFYTDSAFHRVNQRHQEIRAEQPSVKNGSRCLFQDDLPKLDDFVGTSISADKQAIAIFSGYLQVLRYGQHDSGSSHLAARKYLPLKLESVQWLEESVGAAENRRMRLTTDCSSIDFLFFGNDTSSKWTLTSASLLVDLSSSGASSRLVQCSLGRAGKDFGFDYYTNYKCSESMRYTCKLQQYAGEKQPDRIYLWIEQFQYELSGSDSSIKKHMFSKDSSTQCSD